MEFWNSARIVAQFVARRCLCGISLNSFAAPGKFQLADAGNGLLLPRWPRGSASYLPPPTLPDASTGIGHFPKRHLCQLQRSPGEGREALLTRPQLFEFLYLFKI